jgi:hypothetical protein
MSATASVRITKYLLGKSTDVPTRSCDINSNMETLSAVSMEPTEAVTEIPLRFYAFHVRFVCNIISCAGRMKYNASMMRRARR